MDPRNRKIIEVLDQRFDKYLLNYDKYVNLYNVEASKINAISNLIKIKNHIDKNEAGIWKSIKLKKKSIINIILDAQKEPSDFAKKDLLEYDLLDTFFDPIFIDNIGYRFIEKDKLAIEEKINSLNLKFSKSSERRLHLKIESAFKDVEFLQIIVLDSDVLDTLIRKIIENGYPKKLKHFNDIPEEEKAEIIKVGRPPKKGVPQNEIVDFVKSKIFPNGTKTDNKKLIHTTGKREGLPIWNQLALEYFKENPELEINNVITKRWLTERIKKAYEVIVTSMN